MDSFIVRKNPNPSSSSSNTTAEEYQISRSPLKKRSSTNAISNNENSRAYETAKQMFEISKQTQRIRGPIQQIVFDSPFIASDYRLLELDTQLLKEILDDGEELIIRGRPSDFIVACTKEKTYQVKEVESSNSLILLPNLLTLEKDVVNNKENGEFLQIITPSITNLHLELMESPTKFSTRLREILQKNILDLFEVENIDELSGNLTWDDLLNEIQISEKQLHEEIEKYAVVEINGFLFLLSKESQNRILDNINEIFDDPICSNVQIESFTLKDLKENLNDENLPENILKWFLLTFCDRNGENYSLNGIKFCRQRASQILERKDSLKEWKLGEFQREIERLLPIGIELDVDQLKGVALISENIVSGKTVRLLRPQDLPEQIQPRLEALFAIQPLWKREEIELYVLDFCNTLSKVEEFLMRHCRIITKNSVKYFALKQM